MTGLILIVTLLADSIVNKVETVIEDKGNVMATLNENILDSETLREASREVAEQMSSLRAAAIEASEDAENQNAEDLAVGEDFCTD